MQLDLVHYRVTGISPLLMSNPEAMQGYTQALGRKKILAPEEEAERGTYRLPSGQLYVKTLAFRLALVAATTGKRVGRIAARTIISGAVFPAHEVAPLVEPGTDEPLTTIEVSVMRAVVQRSGILRARARLDKWACDVTFEVDRDFIEGLDVLTQLFNESGRLKGIGDYRPERSGMYGRFEVELRD